MLKRIFLLLLAGLFIVLALPASVYADPLVTATAHQRATLFTAQPTQQILITILRPTQVQISSS
jgi:hypothetical protein